MTTTSQHPILTTPADLAELVGQLPAWTLPGHLDHLAELSGLADSLQDVYLEGARAAVDRATWTTDGNGDPDGYARTLRMLQDGDPAAWDHLPAEPNLSGEWADDTTPATIADIQVRPHTARMTGAPWFVVELDGCQVGPYYDDHDQATSIADDIRQAMADAWEAGRDAVWSDAIEAELVRALPNPDDQARDLVAYFDGDVARAIDQAIATALEDADTWPDRRTAELVQAIHLAHLDDVGIVVHHDTRRTNGHVVVEASASALRVWSRGELPNQSGTWPASSLTSDGIEALRVVLDGQGDLIDEDVDGLAYSNQDGCYYARLDDDGNGIGPGVELPASELEAFLSDVLVDVLAVDHGAWFPNAGRHLDVGDPRRVAYAHLTGLIPPTLSKTLRSGATAVVSSSTGHGAGIYLDGESIGNVAIIGTPDGNRYRVLIYAHGYPDTFPATTAGLADAMTYALSKLS